MCETNFAFFLALLFDVKVLKWGTMGPNDLFLGIISVEENWVGYFYWVFRRIIFKVIYEFLDIINVEENWVGYFLLVLKCSFTK